MVSFYRYGVTLLYRKIELIIDNVKISYLKLLKNEQPVLFINSAGLNFEIKGNLAVSSYVV